MFLLVSDLGAKAFTAKLPNALASLSQHILHHQEHTEDPVPYDCCHVCVVCRLRAGRRKRGVKSRWRLARRSQTFKSMLAVWRPSSTLCRRVIDEPPLYSQAAQSGCPLSFRSTVGHKLSQPLAMYPPLIGRRDLAHSFCVPAMVRFSRREIDSSLWGEVGD